MPDMQGVIRDVHDESAHALRISGTIEAGGGLTDAELRATPVDVNVAGQDSNLNVLHDGPVAIAAGGAILHGQNTVATAGTEEALASTAACISVTVKALHTNTGYIHVGTTGVDNASSPGFVLAAGESVTLDTDDVANVHIDATVSGEGVSYIAVT